jgi:programmed cell death 6-interacting protein
MVQAPMIACPLKTTTEVSWVEPLSQYIRTSYGDDPSKYAEEIGTLNRLRQDMRGAGADSASGRDLLYRYYGQLELLDLRFPIDEAHIKISFQWFDAFTRAATSQYSLAFEKASVIFNIAAVLSCHAAAQNRSEDKDLKTAYHSFQASAGMFTYINENFLHAPSTDMNRDTVRTLIHIVLGQAQEVFLEKQVRDAKKSALLAKLAAQAAFLYGQAREELESDHARGIFESAWLKLIQIKALHLSSLAEYYQALSEDETSQQGSAIARLQLAEKSSKQAYSLSKSFPSSPPSASNLGSDTASTMQAITRRQMESVQEKLTSLVKDNDYIYHQTVPAEASLSPVTKVPAAKAIPLSELYQGQDIQRIIGPDIFQKIVPMSVTESASMYDEEKAKLIRSEAEKVEQANGEMAASLDYLKLPNSLNVLKGGLDQEMGVDREFEQWCHELAHHQSFGSAFEQLQKDKQQVLDSLAKSTKQLDMEESVCEKMRSKYGADWTQQPSSRLTSTLRADIKNYRDTVDEAGNSDAQLFSTARQYEGDFEEMRNAGDQGEADVLYQQALLKAGLGSKGRTKSGDEATLLDEDYGEGGISVADQIAKVEDLLRKLNLVKRERMQVLKDLKEKVHTDDISNVLILNKKAIANQETQLFQAELEKFRSHQNRLISTVHKQSSLLKELTKSYGDLLQDKRVRSDQQRYDAMQKSKNSVMNKYRRTFNAHEDLTQGLSRAQGFYSEMKESVDSLEKNVESFVSNRRAEGAQLLHSIEQAKNSSTDGQAAAEQRRMQELMNRLSMEPKSAAPAHQESPAMPPLPPAKSPATASASYPTTNPDPRFTIPPRHSPAPVVPNGYSKQLQTPTAPTNPSPIEAQHAFSQGAATPLSSAYNPMAYPERSAVTSPSQQQPGAYTFSPVTSPPTNPMNAYFPQATPSHQGLNFTPPSHQYPQYGFPSHPPPGATPGPGPYQSPSPHPQMPQSQPPYHQSQHPLYQPSPSPYNMPQNYVPPPPPPGPPGGGSLTQYPPNPSSAWASGPGGYANYTQRYPQQQQGQSHPQFASGQPQSGGTQESDPWAGLSAWK